MASSSTSLMLALATALAVISIVQAGYRRCGIWDCYGTGVYCCGNSCCWHVYSYWWFWGLWAFGIAIIISVVVACCRARRRRNMSNIIVRQAQPVYGSATTAYAYSGPASGYGYQYTAPQAQPAMPASAPAYQEKPPPYNP